MSTWMTEHLRSRQVSRVIYGSIIGLALITVFQDHPPKAGVALATMLGTALAVGLAELYSELIGEELRTGRQISRHAVTEELDKIAAVAFGVAFPSIFFLLALFDVLSVDSALTVAKWTGLGLITFYGIIGARVAGKGGQRAVAEGVAVGLIAAVVIGLKALVH